MDSQPRLSEQRLAFLGIFLDTWPITPFRFFAAMLFRPEARKYCFVTDGGLTENLGIKQLLLRRCKLILAIDAGQDENFEFHDLSKLLRWMQVEQGIKITWQRLSDDDKKNRSDKLGSRPELLMPLVPTQIQDLLTGSRDKSSSVRPTADAVQHHLLARIEYSGYDTATEADREQFVGYLHLHEVHALPERPSGTGELQMGSSTVSA